MSQSNFYHLTPHGKLHKLKDLAATVAAYKRDGFVWLDYHQASRKDLSELMKPFGIHRLTIEDATDKNQVPKIEDYPGNTFVIFNAFEYSNGTLHVFEIDFVIGEKFLVTISGHDCAESQCPLRDIAELVEKEIENARQGPAYLMHVILDIIVDDKFTAIEALEDKLDAAEESILDEARKFNPAELLRVRRHLLSLRKSLFNEREILVKISRKDCPFIQGDAIYPYRDIYDHLSKFFELTETYREIVTSLIEVYMSMINNQMANTNNVMNATIRRLTFIATVFMPLTLLASIGGMSEYSVMTGGEGNMWISYPLFILGMALIALISYWVLKGMDK